MKRYRPSAEDIVGALLMPSPRAGRHDETAAQSASNAVYARDSESPADEESAASRWRLPRPRRSADPQFVRAYSSAVVPSGLSDEVERRLARLAGVEPLPMETRVEEVESARWPRPARLRRTPTSCCASRRSSRWAACS